MRPETEDRYVQARFDAYDATVLTGAHGGQQVVDAVDQHGLVVGILEPRVRDDLGIHG